MYTRSTKFKEVYADLEARGACTPAKTAYLTPFMNTNKEISFGHAIDIVMNDDNARESWVVWTWIKLRLICDSNTREGLLKKIKDPARAFFVRWEFPDLSDNEKSILEQIYKNKLPTAEKQLADGLIKEPT